VVQMLAFNEFESRFSASTTVDCWRSFFLGDVNSIFNIRTMQTRFVETQLRVSDQANSGIVGISEEYHRLNGAQSRVAFNLHEQGTRQKTDVIYLPEGP
jgi:hypothetical protein